MSYSFNAYNLYLNKYINTIFQKRGNLGNSQRQEAGSGKQGNGEKQLLSSAGKHKHHQKGLKILRETMFPQRDGSFILLDLII